MSNETEVVEVNETTIYGVIMDINGEGTSTLVGKLLTLADASIENERQVKAFKDTLRNTIWENQQRTDAIIGEKLYACEEKPEKIPMMSDNAKRHIKARYAI